MIDGSTLRGDAVHFVFSGYWLPLPGEREPVFGSATPRPLAMVSRGE